MAENMLAGRIVRLEIDNVKRLKAVRITPEGNLIVVSGANDAGKSSVLDAIRFALGGPAAMKDTPDVVRQGEQAARVLLELDHVTVTRKIVGGKQAVVIESKDGSTFNSPQGKLDDALSALTFDPLKFARLAPKEQRRILLDMVDLGIDLDAVEEQRAGVFATRTDVGRERDRLTGSLESAPPWALDPSTPVVQVSISDGLAEMNAALLSNADLADLATDVLHASNDVASAEFRIVRADAEALAAKVQLVEARDALLAVIASVDAHAPEIDLAPLSAQLANAEGLNAHIRDRLTYVRTADLRDTKSAEYAALTSDLDTIERSKRNALESAQMPIDGLGISDDGVTFDGLPLSQASESQRAKTSARIQMSLNPGLRVMLIDNGNAFDAKNLEVLAAMAEEYDYQIWTTYVGDSGRPQIVIEDGEVHE
jgi:hypothetical protein